MFEIRILQNCHMLPIQSTSDNARIIVKYKGVKSAPLGLKAQQAPPPMPLVAGLVALILESYFLTLDLANHDTSGIFWDDFVVV